MVTTELPAVEKIPLSPEQGEAVPHRKQYGSKGEINACISFLLFCSQIYLTYASLFGRHVFSPFADFSANNITEGEDTPSSLYSSSVLSILLIVVSGIAGGHLVQFLRLPSLLGMLLVGITLRNAPLTGSVMFVVKEWGVVLRKTAFIIILLRGGLSLDATALRKMKE